MEGNVNITFQTLQGLLDWITGTGGGAFLVVAWFISWAVEGTKFWGQLSSQIKATIIVIASGLIGALAHLLSVHPDIVSAIDPYVRPLMYATMMWLGTQFAHGKNPLRK